MASQDLTTRSGFTPNENELPYSIKTSDVKSYLQKKIDTVISRQAAQTKTQAEDITIAIFSSDMSKYFKPIVILLPLEALDDSGKKKRKTMPSIFDTKSTDGTATIKPEIYKVLSAYTYNKDDMNMFKSDAWRRQCHVSREGARNLMSMRTPKIVSCNNGRSKVIQLVLDPIRIFHDMLTILGDKRPFTIYVPNIQKISSGEFRYDIKREIVRTKKNKPNNSMIEQIDNALRGNMPRRRN